jgi:hypothetical protein
MGCFFKDYKHLNTLVELTFYRIGRWRCLSFGNSLKSLGFVQEALLLGLMLVSMCALFYFDFDFKLKIGIVAIVFALIFLTSIATQLINIQKEIAKAQK